MRFIMFYALACHDEISSARAVDIFETMYDILLVHGACKKLGNFPGSTHKFRPFGTKISPDYLPKFRLRS